MRAGVQLLREKVDRTLARVDRAGPDAVGSLGRLQGELYQDFVDKLERFKKGLDPLPVRAGERPRQSYTSGT